MRKRRVTNIPRVVQLIGLRAAAVGARHDYEVDPLRVAVSVVNVHRHIPLRLQEMLEADDVNFAHDVFGILRHWDIVENKMRDCFLPRFALQLEKL